MSELPAENTSPAPETTAPESPTATPLRRRVVWRKRLRIALRSLLLAAAGALTLFWIYTFQVIAAHAAAQGDSMEWMAAFPMTLIFMLLTLPALIVGLFGRPLIFGTLIAAASVFVNLWVWREILAEFAG